MIHSHHIDLTLQVIISFCNLNSFSLCHNARQSYKLINYVRMLYTTSRLVGCIVQKWKTEKNKTARFAFVPALPVLWDKGNKNPLRKWKRLCNKIVWSAAAATFRPRLALRLPVRQSFTGPTPFYYALFIFYMVRTSFNTITEGIVLVLYGLIKINPWKSTIITFALRPSSKIKQ